MHHDRKELIQPIRVDGIVDGVEKAQLKGERDAVGELDVFLEVFLVLEPLEVEREDNWAVFDLHALFGLLEPAACVAEKFVPLAKHLACAKLSEARGDRRVLLNVDREVKERLVPGGYLNKAAGSLRHPAMGLSFRLRILSGDGGRERVREV